MDDRSPSAALLDLGGTLVDSAYLHAVVWARAFRAHDLTATTAADVERTRPAPDLVAVAVERAGRPPAAMIGDAPWDVRAARHLRIPTIGLLTGGSCAYELLEAGEAAVIADAADLTAGLDETPLRRSTRLRAGQLSPPTLR